MTNQNTFTADNTENVIKWLNTSPEDTEAWDHGWYLVQFRILPFMSVGPFAGFWITAMISSCDEIEIVTGSLSQQESYKLMMLQLGQSPTLPDFGCVVP